MLVDARLAREGDEGVAELRLKSLDGAKRRRLKAFRLRSRSLVRKPGLPQQVRVTVTMLEKTASFGSSPACSRWPAS